MLASDTQITFATASDAAEISEISRTEIEYNLRAVYTQPRVCFLIREPTTNVVVYREAGGLSGFGIMTYREDTANLDLLAVKAPFRRQGIGSDIVRWLGNVALTSGATYIFVQVRKNNANAIRFYGSLGFHIIDEVRGYYEGREVAVVMCKGVHQFFGNP